MRCFICPARVGAEALTERAYGASEAVYEGAVLVSLCANSQNGDFCPFRPSVLLKKEAEDHTISCR